MDSTFKTEPIRLALCDELVKSLDQDHNPSGIFGLQTLIFGSDKSGAIKAAMGNLIKTEIMAQTGMLEDPAAERAHALRDYGETLGYRERANTQLRQVTSDLVTSFVTADPAMQAWQAAQTQKETMIAPGESVGIAARILSKTNGTVEIPDGQRGRSI